MEKDMGKTTQKRYVGNNRYCLEKTLGKGGFGITWLAVDQENEQKVVIKELCPPPGETREKEIRNFLREARVMASLHSVKEIVKVLNYFEEQGNAYIVMEYLRLTSLRYYLECQDEPLSFEKARNLLLPVMDGLEATKAIRGLEREDAKKIPIIAMTANAFKEDRKACLDAGMDEHIGKPIDIPLLKRTITKLLTKNHKNRIYNETDINIE